MISPMGGKAHGGLFQYAGNGNNQATGLGYDAAGNLTNYTAPGQYVYDPENRIQSTAGVTYTYDADGNRVEKSGGTASTLYWYGAPGIIAESDLSGTLKSEYVFFNGKRLARIDLLGGTVHYYLSDHLNSTSIVVSASGVPEEESDYSPFGTEYVVTGPGTNHYKFTGKERDSESGLDYFGARYYSNGLGRFITPDWAAKATAVPYAEFSDPQSLNLYTYVRNVPTTRVDLDGHLPMNSAQDFINLVKSLYNWSSSHTHSGEKSGETALADKTASKGALTVNAKVASAEGTVSGAVSPIGVTGKVEGNVGVASTTIGITSHSETKVKALTAKAEASGTLGLTSKGSGIAGSAGAHADVISGSETLTLGPVSITATGEVGFGGELGGSITNSGLTGTAGLSPGAGGDISVSINWGSTGISSSASRNSDKKTEVTPMKVEKK